MPLLNQQQAESVVNYLLTGDLSMIASLLGTKLDAEKIAKFTDTSMKIGDSISPVAFKKRLDLLKLFLPEVHREVLKFPIYQVARDVVEKTRSFLLLGNALVFVNDNQGDYLVIKTNIISDPDLLELASAFVNPIKLASLLEDNRYITSPNLIKYFLIVAKSIVPFLLRKKIIVRVESFSEIPLLLSLANELLSIRKPLVTDFVLSSDGKIAYTEKNTLQIGADYIYSPPTNTLLVPVTSNLGRLLRRREYISLLMKLHKWKNLVSYEDEFGDKYFMLNLDPIDRSLQILTARPELKIGNYYTKYGIGKDKEKMALAIELKELASKLEKEKDEED